MNIEPTPKGAKVTYPEPPQDPPHCPKCREDDPTKLLAQSNPPSVLCRSCGQRFSTIAGWVPYLRRVAEAAKTERRLELWQGLHKKRSAQ